MSVLRVCIASTDRAANRNCRIVIDDQVWVLSCFKYSGLGSFRKAFARLNYRSFFQVECFSTSSVAI